MADVEMSDAPSATKKADATNGKGLEGKKKFEVKKVSCEYPRFANASGHFLTLPANLMDSGMLLPSGRGILLLITAPFAAITSWICV